jgi:hypothetical protein
MSDDITVKDCRILLLDIRDEHITEKHVESLSSLSDEQKFYIAKQLLPEIGLYDNIQPKTLKMNLIFILLAVFEEYNNISREEFVLLLDGASVSATSYIIQNDAFPVDFLVDLSFLHYNTSNLKNIALGNTIHFTRMRRILEVLSYCKGIVPDSEHMSDEMVLSVAGVKV